MRRLIAAVAAVTFACGGGDSSEEAASTPSASAAPPAAAAVVGGAGGAVHTVDMILNDQGQYRYVPAQLTIKVGDTVRWVNVSGGPHNVQFKTDGIPAGAEDALNAAMSDRIGPVNGPLLIQPNAAYEISFAGAPTGVYNYTCTPHELLGMSATLTVGN